MATANKIIKKMDKKRKKENTKKFLDLLCENVKADIMQKVVEDHESGKISTEEAVIALVRGLL